MRAAWLLFALTGAPGLSAVAALTHGAAALPADAAPRTTRRIALSEPGPAEVRREASASLVELSVPGHASAVLALPPANGSARPVIVVAHGAWDRAEDHCRIWQATVAGRAFVLCPRGVPTDRRVAEDERFYYFPDHHALGAEIAAALEALAREYPGRVDLARPAYAGFSQGAIMGAILLSRHPMGFAHAVLVEGGNGEFDEWSVAHAEQFARAGGERVLVACGRAHCAKTAAVTKWMLGKGGVEGRVLHVAGAGHSYGGAMEAEVRRAFAWVVERDARWAGLE